MDPDAELLHRCALVPTYSSAQQERHYLYLQIEFGEVEDLKPQVGCQIDGSLDAVVVNVGLINICVEVRKMPEEESTEQVYGEPVVLIKYYFVQSVLMAELISSVFWH